MKTKKRQNKIIELLQQRNFISIRELSHTFSVSEMTIRRDLETLSTANLIKKTYGGAIPVITHPAETGMDALLSAPPILKPCQSDVLVITSFDPRQNPLFLDKRSQPQPPIIAESVSHPSALTLVAIDDYHAGFDLGCWVGEYAIQHWHGTANVLVWGYDLPNTEARSRGFLSGLSETIPSLGEVISLNPTAQDDLAYQLTRDALQVNDNINVIFAINDNNAWGAIQACIDLEIDPAQTIVIPFGLEGDLLKNAIHQNLYCPVGLAMFPEIVGHTCVDAAIAAHNHQQLPEKIETPYVILTRETLPEFYRHTESGWEIIWENVQQQNRFSLKSTPIPASQPLTNPGCIGIFLTFPNHEWYQNMFAAMQSYAGKLGISIEILDSDRNLKDELLASQRRIAERAALEVCPGDTVFIDGGNITNFLAENIRNKENITVITNATPIFKCLEDRPNITLVSTGGILRRSTWSLVGPNAENSIHDIRVDKLFLTASGISLNFGLSHSDISEVTIKQAMIKSAREVILLADFTQFDQESFFQIAPIRVIHKLITDSNLPANKRLQFNSAGIEVITS